MGVCLLGGTACEDFYNPNAPSELADSVLQLSASVPSVPADGFSVATVEAKITEKAAPERREITFITTLGTFAGGKEEGGRRITRKASAGGVASVDLVSATRSGTARIVAEGFGGIIAETDVEFVEINSGDLLRLTVTRDSLPADGFSRTRLVATVAPGVPAGQRAVTLRTTEGAFVGSPEAGRRSMVVEPDGNGRAWVELESARRVGVARVSAEIALEDFVSNRRAVVQEAVVYFTPVDPSTIVKVSTSRREVAADGASTVYVYADVAAQLPHDRRTVTFSTSRGTIAPTTVRADHTNRATAELISATMVGSARIVAEVDGVTASTEVVFERALPDWARIAMDVTRMSRRASARVAVKAMLRRGVGVPSMGTMVEYSATLNGAAVGFFSDVEPSNERGEARALFNIGSSGPTGLAVVRVAVPGTSVVASARLEIID